MAKTYAQVLSSLIDKTKARLPDADLTSGSVIREILEACASEVSTVYAEMDALRRLQSIRTATGTDLDRLAANYSMSRRTSRSAVGSVLCTRANLLATESFVIKTGNIVSTVSTSLVTGSPIQYRITSDISVSGSNRDIYKALASQYRSYLDANGITDIYAISVPVTAVASGSASNVSRGSVRRHNIYGVGNVINVQATTGGADVESDEDFRRRLVLAFAGSNITTNYGLKSFVLTQEGVDDAAIIGPGHTLMTRDGSKVENGTIISSGSGGMIDVYMTGKSLEQESESFIFINRADVVANEANDYVLGKPTYVDPTTNIAKTLDYRNRRQLINQNITLRQPIEQVASLVGSQSGNFIEGINYILLRDIDSTDPTSYANSGFGFDRLRWISDSISVTEEAVVRSSVAYDPTRYTDITSIDSITYPIRINGETAIITTTATTAGVLNSSTDTTPVLKIVTRHSPVSSVSSVDNPVTGERYKIEAFSAAGDIYISGRALPNTNDTVLLAYDWNKTFDPTFDFTVDNNLINWTNANTTILDSTSTFTGGIVTATPITLTAPAETAVTIKGKGLNSKAVYLHGTSMSTVMNQTQTLTATPQLDSTGTYYVLSVVAPIDIKTNEVIGGAYQKDVLTAFATLARSGDPIGRVYPATNPRSLDGTLVGYVLYKNGKTGEDLALEYSTLDSDPLAVLLPVASIQAPKANDNIELSFMWESRHPVSANSTTEKIFVGGVETLYYRLGEESSTTDSVLRDINNVAYLNPNTNMPNVGNYDKITYVGSIGSTNNKQYSYKRFVELDRVTVSDVANITGVKLESLRQPTANTKYYSSYTYAAPKDGERITVLYYYNKLVNDVTQQIENQRIINSDILIKAGKAVPLAVGVSVVASTGSDATAIESCVTNALLTTLNSNVLGSRQLNTSFATSEVFRLCGNIVSVNFTRFSRLTDTGVKPITLEDNEYYSLDGINVQVAVVAATETVQSDYYTTNPQSLSQTPTGTVSTCPSERNIVVDAKSCAPR